MASLIVTSGTAYAGGATLYADPTPQGAGSCADPADACTLPTALAEAVPGSTVALENGATYGGDLTVTTPGTTSASPVRIEPVTPTGTAPVIDGGGTSFDLSVGNMYLWLEDLTLQGSGGGAGQPAVVNNGGGNVTVIQCQFQNNHGYDGGAIDNGDTLVIGGKAGGTVTVMNSTFSNNVASGGGAILNEDGTVNVSSSIFDDNVANGNGGGAISNGLQDGPAVLNVTGSSFADNSARTFGGAIQIADDAQGTATVLRSTFTSNTAGQGGGAISLGTKTASSGGTGTLALSQSTFVDNTAAPTPSWPSTQEGGAIDVGDGGTGILTLTYSTFEGNTASTAGQTMELGANSGTGTVTLDANLIDGSCTAAGGGTWIDKGYNDVSDSTCGEPESGGLDVIDSGMPGDLTFIEAHPAPTLTSPAIALVPNGSLGCPVIEDGLELPSPSSAPCTAGAVQVPMGVQIYLQTAPLGSTPGPVPYVIYVIGLEGSSGVTPTGTVHVSDGVSFCDAALSQVAPSFKGVAIGQCNLTESAAGAPYTVTAEYEGDGMYAATSSSATVASSVAGGGGVASTQAAGIGVSGTGGTAGTDAVTVANYSSNPVDGQLTDGQSYFDVGTSSGASFSTLKIDDCSGVTSSTTLSWWSNSSEEYLPVEGAPGPTFVPGTGGNPNCLDVVLNNTSTSPKISELVGTAFGVAARPLGVRTTSLPHATVGVRYREQLMAGGGNAPYHWRLLSGKLPRGFALSKSGLLSGESRSLASAKLTLAVTDTATRGYVAHTAVLVAFLQVLPPAPVVTRIAPAVGPSSGSTSVTLTGRNLGNVRWVSFGGVLASSVVVNSKGTKVTLMTPQHHPGKVKVFLGTPSGTSKPVSFTYTPPT